MLAKFVTCYYHRCYLHHTVDDVLVFERTTGANVKRKCINLSGLPFDADELLQYQIDLNTWKYTSENTNQGDRWTDRTLLKRRSDNPATYPLSLLFSTLILKCPSVHYPYTPSFISSVALFNSRIASLVSGRRSHAIAPQHMLIFLHLLCSACRQNWMINPMPRDMQANKPVSVNVKDVVIIHYTNIF